MIQRGDIAPRIGARPARWSPISRAEIVNQWSLWWGVTMMVVGSLVGLFAQAGDLHQARSRRSRRRRSTARRRSAAAHRAPALDLVRRRADPQRRSAPAVTHEFFGVPWLLAFISLPLIFVLTVICTNSMALTSWTPTGALSKITQFTMGAIDRTNPATNLIPAAMTAEIASNAVEPALRHQARLHARRQAAPAGDRPRHRHLRRRARVACRSSSCSSCRPDADGVRSTATIVSEQFAMPAAMQWKGVADLITKGFSRLPTRRSISMIVAAVCAVAFEVARIATKGRFPLSAVSIGLGVVLPPEACSRCGSAR